MLTQNPRYRILPRVSSILISDTDSSAKGKVRRGFFFMRPDSAVIRNIATSAPHPLNDQKSAHIMAKLFDEGTRTFSVTGAHRCFSNDERNPEACNGDTTACSNANPKVDEPRVSTVRPNF